MKIFNLTEGSTLYTSNVYLLTGTWNTLDDVNTLVDVGRDPAVIDHLMDAATGVGKKRLEAVVLTHCHYDHASMLNDIIALFSPRVYAYSRSIDCVHRLVTDGDRLKLADRHFEVMYLAGHSNDSICLYNDEEGVLFSGDAPLVIRSSDGSYEEHYVQALERLCKRDVNIIYPGHGPPLRDNCNTILRQSLQMVRSSMV